MAELSTTAGLEAIAIDGKACRAAPRDTFSECLHLVNAWATENNLFLGAVAVADGNNEITAVPALLKVLDLKGALVTLDAGFCQTEILAQIREQDGDYVVTVKGNQPTLHRAVVAAFARAAETEFEGCTMAARRRRARAPRGAVRDGAQEPGRPAGRVGRHAGGGDGRARSHGR